MMTVLYILLGIVGLIILFALIAPKSYEVSRSIVINKPVSEVFEFLKYLKNHEVWSPWEKKDPNMKKTFTGTDGTVGAISAWVGNKDVGEGEQEILNIIENKTIESKLRFFKPWKSESDAYLRTEEVNGGTKVVWGFSGVNKVPTNIFMLFMNMDKTVGKDFEEGLASLKTHLENKK
jgi:hypothetical protein